MHAAKRRMNDIIKEEHRTKENIAGEQQGYVSRGQRHPNVEFKNCSKSLLFASLSWSPFSFLTLSLIFLPVSALLRSTLSLSLFSLRLLRLSREADRSLLLSLSLPLSLSFLFEECLFLCFFPGDRDRERDLCRLRFDGRRESSEVSEPEEESDDEGEELLVRERPRRSVR